MLSGDIGCNLEVQSLALDYDYTENLYLKRISDYQHYGIRYLEFPHVLALTQGDAENLRTTSRLLGLIPWSVHSEHLNPGHDLKEYFALQTHCALIANALDARVMVCHLPNLAPRFDSQRDLDILTHLADITANYNVKLAIENCGFQGEIDFIIQLIDHMKHPNVGFNLDTGHAFYGEHIDLPEAINKIGKHLITLHLHDNFGTNDDHQAPGLGNICWQKVLKALADINYEGPLMMELGSANVRARRSLNELRDFDLEKEIIWGSAYLKFLLNNVQELRM